MKVHCLFEQSGTFKNVFKNLGYESYDYDLFNKFFETDFILDLFNEINLCFDSKSSIFDSFTSADLIFAFFPCTRFSTEINLHFRGDVPFQRNWDLEQKLTYDISLHKLLDDYYSLICKLFIICYRRNFKLIFENPYSPDHYLIRYWCLKPDLIDYNRSIRGDNFIKPTAYWFLNISPQNNIEFQSSIPLTDLRRVGTSSSGIDRSLISSSYAERFIKEFVLKKGQVYV